MWHQIRHTLSCLSIAVERRLLLRSLDIVKMEQVWVQDDLGAVIKKNTVAAVWEHVAETILRAEVNELNDEFSSGLAFRSSHKNRMIYLKCTSRLYFSKLRCRLLIRWLLLWIRRFYRRFLNDPSSYKLVHPATTGLVIYLLLDTIVMWLWSEILVAHFRNGRWADWRRQPSVFVAQNLSLTSTILYSDRWIAWRAGHRFQLSTQQFASWSKTSEHVLSFEKVVYQNLLERLVVLEHLRIVKSGLVVVQRVELADDSWPWGLPVESDLTRCGACFFTAENVSVVLVAVLDPVNDKGWVHGAFDLIVGGRHIWTRSKRFLGFNLAESVFKRSGLHMVQNTLLANSSRTHWWRWHISICHRWLHR